MQSRSESAPAVRPVPTADPAPFDGDVFVIGGGPAGSTIAALLAAQGRSVLLAERARHPRFHIGESLLPANAGLFDRLGVRPEIERIGLAKYGVEFVSPDHAEPGRVEFGEAWDKSMTHAWQVRRSDLDEILFRNATHRGAQAFEGCRVRQVEFDDDGATVHAELDDGARRSWRVRFVVDASGRDTLLANAIGCKRKNLKHNSSALYAHYRGARRLPGKLEGNITIFWFEHGWFWFIPLADGTTSIGAVCWPYYLKSRDKRLPDFFADTIAMCPALAERLGEAERVSDVQATGNYAYSSTVSSGDRYLMLGDAYAFIDPVFSSGVLLAMQSAFAGVEVVEARLDRPRQAARARRRFDRLMRHGPREFSWFIFRVSSPTMREMFMQPQNPLRVKEALLSLLAGDIFGKTPIWPSIFAIKLFYYLISLGHLGRSLAFWRRRRVNIRDHGAPAS